MTPSGRHAGLTEYVPAVLAAAAVLAAILWFAAEARRRSPQISPPPYRLKVAPRPEGQALPDLRRKSPAGF